MKNNSTNYNPQKDKERKSLLSPGAAGRLEPLAGSGVFQDQLVICIMMLSIEILVPFSTHYFCLCVCVCVCMCLCAPSVCRSLQRPEEGIRYTGSFIPGG